MHLFLCLLVLGLIIKYMIHEFEEEPRSIWQSNMFGKSLYELMNEGLHTKLSHMPMDARIHMEIWDYATVCTALVTEVKYDELANTIDLC